MSYVFSDTAKRANRRAAFFWGFVIIGLLASQVAVGVVSVVLATSDPSFAVVPDYHEKALKWDEAVAAKHASDKLGWVAELSLSPSADQLGQRTLVASFVDKEGNPVSDLQVNVRAFHHARANDVVQETLRMVNDGNYAIELPMPKDGLWEIELVASRGTSERFELTKTINTMAANP